MDELCEVIDAEHNVLRIASRNEIREKALRHKSAFVIVKNSKGLFFAAQRSPAKKNFPLKWELGAGGGVHAGETFYAAAKRELEEELGIKTEELKYIMDFDYNSKTISYWAQVFITLWDGKVKTDPEEFVQGKRKWVSEEDILQMTEKDLLCPDTALYFKKYLGLGGTSQ